MPQDIHKRNFDVTKNQLAHDLTIVKLLRSGKTSTDTSLLYDEYLEELQYTKAVIEDKTRYEVNYTEPVSFPDDED
ncbi:hypothetical protein C7445_1286 [Alicyclobacillus sacchari]|uniref:Uncharacterized protein n=1 Tax=Alicyclobacillus sacchari TaxID=392010 RepID=A0A4R8L8D9_9BACL|nr:hypothetical protein [Alicyclobacillus sacchari]TDY38981.1 hypothetical protein C7445_1286 [Alicyclobacillus sacchari]